MPTHIRDALFENIVRHVDRHQIPEIVIYMHGGEPLMAGIPYIEEWLRLAREKIGPHCKLNISLQTNGLLLSREWIDLFARYGVRLGISLDGPKAAHDEFRIDKKGRGTYDRLTEKLAMLLAHPEGGNVFGSILSVANTSVAPSDLMTCWEETGFARFDFNLPHCTHDNPPPFAVDDLSAWLREFFDLWWQKDDPRFDIRFFRNLVLMTLGAASSVDYIGGGEIGIVVVETDGSIQGTDALRACKDGLIETGLNVTCDELQSAMDFDLIRLCNSGAADLSAVCRGCEVNEICGGGYYPHRYSEDRGFDNPSVYCEALKDIISHVKQTVLMELEPA